MCLGFLPHNLHPARIFMGDSGSMLIGLVLAAARDLASPGRRPDARSVRRPSRQPCSAGRCIPLLLPLSDHRVPARRPGPGHRAAHLARPVAVRRRPRAPAPPAAGDRALAQPRGADHVLLVGADRLRRASPTRCTRASMWIVLERRVASPSIGAGAARCCRASRRAARRAQDRAPPRHRRSAPRRRGARAARPDPERRGPGRRRRR